WFRTCHRHYVARSPNAEALGISYAAPTGPGSVPHRTSGEEQGQSSVIPLLRRTCSCEYPLPQADDLIENTLGDFPFGGFGDLGDRVVSDDGDRVAIGIKADTFAGDIVHYDSVERFGGQLLAGIFQCVLGFGGEAYNDLRISMTRDLREDIHRRLKLERYWSTALDFLGGRRFRTIVGYCGGFYDYRR